MSTQFEKARKLMVDCQIRPSKVTDKSVLNAFLAVPRELFVGKNYRSIAYVDEDLPISGGRSLMVPVVLARLLQALNLKQRDNVLVIGAGSGYGTAIVAKLAGSVIAVEARNQLVERAQELLVLLGADNAAVIKSRLVDGYKDEGPYDGILIEGGVEMVPRVILEQLTVMGKLAAIYRRNSSPVGEASIWTRSGTEFARKTLFDARVPNLDEFNKKPEFVF